MYHKIRTRFLCNKVVEEKKMFSGASNNSLQYDLLKFKQFLVGSSLEKLKGKSAVLLLGRMGSGKSTTITVQLGGEYELKYNEAKQKKERILVHSPTETPKTSDGITSTTLNINSYLDETNQLLYIDTAGLNESRGEEEKIWTRSSLRVLFSSVRELKAVVLPINYPVIFCGDRDEGIQKLSEVLADIGIHNDQFYNSMIFLIKNGRDEEGEKITISSLIAQINQMCAELKRRENDLILRLNNRFPLSATDIAKLLAVEATGKIKSSNCRFDVKEVSRKAKNDLDNLHFLQNSQVLLSTMAANQGSKILLAYPNSPEECREMKKDLLVRILNNTPLSRDLLQTIQNQHDSDANLIFLNILCDLATSYLSDLSAELLLLEKLNKAYAQNKKILDAIERNWQEVRHQLVEQKKQEIIDERTVLDTQKEEIRRLEASIKKVVHVNPKMPAEVCAEKKGGAFWWVLYLGSAAVAEKSYTYSDQPFVERRIHGENYEIVDEQSDSDKGKLEIKFRSSNGYDLNLKVEIMVYEKDLPATKTRVFFLKQENTKIEGRIATLRESITSLKSINNKKELYDEVTKENEELRSELELAANKFKNPLGSEEESEWHAVKALERIFLLLENLKIIHPNLSDPNKATIKDFLKKCSEISKEASKDLLQRIDPNIAKTAKYIPEPLNKEKNNPVIRKTFFNQVKQMARTVTIPKASDQHKDFLQEHKFELGCCMALLGYLLWFDISRHRLSIIPILLMVYGAFVSLSATRIFLKETLIDVKRITKENKEEFMHVLDVIELEAKKANMTAGKLGLFAIDRMAEQIKINTDIKADIKALPKAVSVFSGVNAAL